MEFVRKLNLLCNSSISKSNNKSDSLMMINNNCSIKNNNYNTKENNSTNSIQANSRNSPFRRKHTTKNQLSSPPRNNSNNNNNSNRKSTRVKKANSSNSYSVNGKTDIIYSTPSLDVPLNKLEDHLLNNSNRRYLANNASFRMHRINNNAFKLIYRSFKETEVINELRYECFNGTKIHEFSYFLQVP